MSKTFRRQLLATTLLMAAVTPALAQDVAPAVGAAAEASDPMDTIVVTGSRIKGVTNLNNPSPISVSTAASIQLTKATSVEDILSKMVGPDANGLANGSNNGGNGASSVSLRSLGDARTLVLMDGNRLIPNGSVVDLNAIPVSMIARIEVLRDGASSIYGADAIGGVVNIITKQNEKGFTLDLGGNVTQRGGGETYNIAATAGVGNDRGNAMVTASWDHRATLWGYQRDWANRPYIGTDGEGGSVYRTQLDILQAESDITLQNNVVINGILTPAGTTVSGLVAANGQFYTRTNPAVAGLAPALLYLPNVGAVKLNANGDPGHKWNSLTGSLDRKQLGFTGHYDITDGITTFLDGFYSRRTSEQYLRPEPLLGDTIATFDRNGNTIYPGLIIPANAPGNQTGVAFPAYLTPVQFGPRDYYQVSDTWRLRAGLRGDLGQFSWELAGVEQENSEVLQIRNSGNFLHLGQLEGVFPCIDAPGGCTNGQVNVQPNWFAGPDNIFSPAQLDYAKYTRRDYQTASERYVYGNIGGSIFTLPAGDVKVSVGGEYRGEHYSYDPDPLTPQGFTANQTFATKGGYNVASAYGEILVPVLKDKPFFKSLDITGSGRYDHYNNFGSAETWRVGMNWAISDDLRLRGSYSTGFRAPQVFELFAGQYISDNGASGDPCETNLALAAGGNDNVGKGVLAAGSKCSVAVAGGAAVTTFTDPLDLIGGSQQQVLQGGSPALQPEKSRSYSVGGVFTPRVIPGLSLAVDYYRTKVKNVILTGGVASNFGTDYVLLDCYGAAQNQVSCDKVRRNGAGVITQINSLNDNGGSQVVRGVDIELSYNSAGHMNLPFDGSVFVDLQASHLIRNDITDVAGTPTKYAGKFSVDNEIIYPKWKGVANIDYKISDWTLHWDALYNSPLDNYDGSPAGFGNHVKSYWVHSFSIAVDLKDIGILSSERFVLGVDNVFDKDPPFISSDSTCKCNSIAGPYDVTGRSIYARVTAKF